MIKISIIALGKLKEKFLKDGALEYIKRLSAYCKLDIIEIEPEKISEKPSQKEIDICLEKESSLIEKKILSNSLVVALCVEGKEFTSEQLANKIEELSNIGKSITFIIGSSYGLSPKIKALANIKLSVSKMTFPHQLFRVMLLEQLYRAFKINEGSQYHK